MNAARAAPTLTRFIDVTEGISTTQRGRRTLSRSNLRYPELPARPSWAAEHPPDRRMHRAFDDRPDSDFGQSPGGIPDRANELFELAGIHHAAVEEAGSAPQPAQKF